eukprot:7554612-Lingulodinium_polyedra.AAC.1
MVVNPVIIMVAMMVVVVAAAAVVVMVRRSGVGSSRAFKRVALRRGLRRPSHLARQRQGWFACEGMRA